MNEGKPQAGPQPGPGLRSAVGRVGDRWSLLLVHALLEGPRRWRDLAEALPGIAPNVLAGRLRRLEREGIVSASPYSRRPLRLTYDLTSDGRALSGVLRLLAAWGGEDPAAPHHARCGSPLEVRWFCATCGEAPEEGADEVTLV